MTENYHSFLILSDNLFTLMTLAFTSIIFIPNQNWRMFVDVELRWGYATCRRYIVLPCNTLCVIQMHKGHFGIWCWHSRSTSKGLFPLEIDCVERMSHIINNSIIPCARVEKLLLYASLVTFSVFSFVLPAFYIYLRKLKSCKFTSYTCTI